MSNPASCAGTGRRVVKLSQLSSLPESVCGDIVVMGVLSNKTATKLGAKGERYSMWFINNLNGSEMTLFLFGAGLALQP
jgi:hypothetical protein